MVDQIAKEGQRSERSWLRALPGRWYFKLEERAETQITADVWDTCAPSDGDGVNEIERLEVTF
jgi:hypothetical protein